MEPKKKFINAIEFNDIKKDLDYMFYMNRCADLLDIPWRQLKGSSLKPTNQFNYFD